MTNFLNIAIKPVPIRSWLFAGIMVWYISLSVFIFYQWVGPSMDERSDQHIAADSVTYLAFADSIKNTVKTLWSSLDSLLFPTRYGCRS